MPRSARTSRRRTWTARSTRPATSARPTRSSSARSSATGAAMTVELHHRFDGPEDAPVVVLSNSIGTSLEMWDDQVPALAERFRVLRYDQRGHGAHARRAGSVRDRRPRPATCSRCSTTSAWSGWPGLRLLARRDDRPVARDQRARADRPAGALLHLRPHAAARDVGRARGHRARARDGGDRGGRARALVHPGAGRAATRGGGGREPDAAGRRARGLRRVLRGDRRPRPARLARSDRGADAGHRRRRGSRHAAGPRARDGGRDRRRAAGGAGRRAPPREHGAPGRGQRELLAHLGAGVRA